MGAPRDAGLGSPSLGYTLHMRHGLLALSLAAILAAGCRPGTGQPEDSTPTPVPKTSEAAATGDPQGDPAPGGQPAPAEQPSSQAQRAPGAAPRTDAQQGVLYISGPGGTVQLGDTLEQAKRAFPPPAGAQVHETTFSLHLISRRGWAWESGMEKSFEVALDEDGKVAGLAVTEQGDSDELLRRASRLHGEPHQQAKGKAASMYSWLRGPNALVVLHIDAPGLPTSRIQVLGNSSKLELIGYPVDRPQDFVRQADEMSAEAGKL